MHASLPLLVPGLGSGCNGAVFLRNLPTLAILLANVWNNRDWGSSSLNALCQFGGRGLWLVEAWPGRDEPGHAGMKGCACQRHEQRSEARAATLKMARTKPNLHCPNSLPIRVLRRSRRLTVRTIEPNRPVVEPGSEPRSRPGKLKLRNKPKRPVVEPDRASPYIRRFAFLRNKPNHPVVEPWGEG